MTNKFKPVPRCKNCFKPIRRPAANHSGYCSNCGSRRYLVKRKLFKGFKLK